MLAVVAIQYWSNNIRLNATQDRFAPKIHQNDQSAAKAKTPEMTNQEQKQNRKILPPQTPRPRTDGEVGHQPPYYLFMLAIVQPHALE